MPTVAADLVCMSHLRWNFVFQRPQHLMVRFAQERRVFFVEEPVFDATDGPRLEVALKEVHVVTPHLPADGEAQTTRILRRLMTRLSSQWRLTRPLVWLYTPLAWPLVSDFESSAVVYDCMDELSGFAGASPRLEQLERQLMAGADLMFTGGHSLYEAKKTLHGNVHPFPSSVDVSHFARARAIVRQPADQRYIPHPRVGFCGVIDERMNLDLVRDVAAARPDWQIVMIGPVAKIQDDQLPRASNIHYLGMKSYAELPAYFAGWDVGIMPFAHNAATRFISPTKTPEYLAAGCPVVSTSIRDVVRPYGEQGMVTIADDAARFEEAIARALGPEGARSVAKADPWLATLSWDRTWTLMNRHVRAAELANDPEQDQAVASSAAASV